MRFNAKIFFRFSSKNRLFRVISRRKIDCAHSRSMKMFPWPWFREINVCIEAKVENFWNFSLKIIFLGVISCGESIVRIPEPWKRFLDPGSGKLAHVGFLLQYTLWFPWIRVKEAFSRFGNARNRFSAWNYPQKYDFKGEIFRFSLQYIHLFPWIKIKEAFLRFGNARNRFFAWFYPYIGCFGKTNFSPENDLLSALPLSLMLSEGLMASESEFRILVPKKIFLVPKKIFAIFLFSILKV